VLERAWASRAGIGWIGKNSLILREGMGSWMFLGTILTTAQLKPDVPVDDRCGSCNLCIDACPTHAIVEPCVVDSRRCISYHTIENKGAISNDLQKAFDNWIFGCDICQEVCPWNSKPVVTSENEFHPREGHANPDLDSLTHIDEPTFVERFAGTPVMRAKVEGMRRNASIARKNTS